MEALESSPKKLTIANSPQRNMALHVSPKKEYSDRFIPTRSAYDLDTSDLFFVKEEEPTKTENLKEENSMTYQMLLRNELLGTPFKSINANTPSTSPTKPSPSPKKSNLFKFKIDKSEPIDSPYSLSPISSESQKILSSPRKPPRKIQKNAVKVLEAPAIQDDFYLNLVDWSAQNTLAVGLGSCVFLWNASTSHVSKLVDLGSSDAVTSVSWTQRGTHLAVGTNKGMVQLWDISHNKMIRNMAGHKSRVGSVAWNGPLLSSGSRDRVILHRDVRESIDYNARLVGHKQEVCGLKWSYDGTQLASGGNDNKLLLWDARNTAPLAKFADHVAAVKAIAWSPHQRGLLASGGGTADRCIRFWNTLTQTPISKLDTGSQVCNLAWSENVNELVSTHGYSQNQIVVWSYPTMNQIATLTGHSMRVLYLAVSPDGQTIITGAGDETLRMWNVFPPKPSATKANFLQFKNEIR